MAVVGLDIGTSNCCCYVSLHKDGSPELVPTAMGGHLTPSYVAYTDKNILVGETAKQQQSSNPLNTFFEFKRVIGRSYEQRDLWKDAKHWPFKLVRSDKDRNQPSYPAVYCGDIIQLSALDLYTLLITSMLSTVKAMTPAIEGIVVTVPAHFDHVQRKQTLQAVERSGASCPIQVLNEPSAAAIAYAEQRDDITSGDCLVVFDLGAGTLDVTCVAVQADGTFEILGSEGCCNLGGSDFDQRLLKMASAHYKQHTDRALSTNKYRLVCVRDACEQAKKTLSVATETQIHVADDIPPMEVTRGDFETAVAPDIRRCNEIVWTLLHRLHKEPKDISHVIMCGGSSRVPAVRSAVQEMFEGKLLLTNINADECVALGACVYARNMCPLVKDVLTNSIGIKTGHNIMLTLAPKDTALPVEATQSLLPLHKKQSYADICVYQGESQRTEENRYLGFVRLEGLRPGHPCVKLIIKVDTNAMVHLDACDDEGHRVIGKIEI
jgi:heat shock protein 1/8